MVIIFNDGGNFWIDFITLPSIVMADAAGRYTSTDVTITKAGVFVGGAIYQSGGGDNDNTQSIGAFNLRAAGGDPLAFGDFITQISWRVDKQAGTAGNTNANARLMLFMKKRGLPS